MSNSLNRREKNLRLKILLIDFDKYLRYNSNTKNKKFEEFLMSRVAIITDTSAGFTPQQAVELGLTIVPIPFIINGEEYIENVNLTREKFFKLLEGNSNISTSQTSQIVLKECFDSLLASYDEIVFIPLSSGLTGICKTTKPTADEYNGRVQVVDNKRVSVTLKGAVLIAVELVKEGKSAKEIKEYLETDTFNSSIYITLTTLKYLKKGGRITATAAAIGTLLKIKPVLQIQGDKLDAYAKVMTMQQAKSKMINAVKKDLETRFKKYYDNGEMAIAIAHTSLNDMAAQQFAEEIKQEFPNLKFSYVDPLPLAITCHTGPDALALVVFKTYKDCLNLIK